MRGEGEGQRMISCSLSLRKFPSWPGSPEECYAKLIFDGSFLGNFFTPLPPLVAPHYVGEGPSTVEVIHLEACGSCNSRLVDLI